MCVRALVRECDSVQARLLGDEGVRVARRCSDRRCSDESAVSNETACGTAEPAGRERTHTHRTWREGSGASQTCQTVRELNGTPAADGHGAASDVEASTGGSSLNA